MFIVLLIIFLAAVTVVAGTGLAILIGVVVAIVTRKSNWAIKFLEEMDMI